VPELPVIEVKMWAGRSEADKAKIIKELTEVFTRMGVPQQNVWVILQEIPKNNWGISGKPSA
jgi:4-oxalocrotonate tautomerase